MCENHDTIMLSHFCQSHIWRYKSLKKCYLLEVYFLSFSFSFSLFDFLIFEICERGFCMNLNFLSFNLFSFSRNISERRNTLLKRVCIFIRFCHFILFNKFLKFSEHKRVHCLCFEESILYLHILINVFFQQQRLEFLWHLCLNYSECEHDNLSWKHCTTFAI